MTDTRTERLNLAMSKGMIKAIDEWRRKEIDLPPRAEATRRLIALALKADMRADKPAGGKGR
jgi:hypothetical protein